MAEISTHALTWSATAYYCLQAITVKNFNSRAHVERDSVRHYCAGGGAGFQLTRSRGARRTGQSFLPFRCNFNSRAHVERDHFPLLMLVYCLHFNSRAHVERDLQYYISAVNQLSHFNSRAHVERDSVAVIQIKASDEFQLTRSRGARRVESKSKDFFVEEFQLTRSRGARHLSCNTVKVVE